MGDFRLHIWHFWTNIFGQEDFTIFDNAKFRGWGKCCDATAEIAGRSRVGLSRLIKPPRYIKIRLVTIESVTYVAVPSLWQVRDLCVFVGDVEMTSEMKLNDAGGLLPSAPDLLSRSTSDQERPPNYEESART